MGWRAYQAFKYLSVPYLLVKKTGAGDSFRTGAELKTLDGRKHVTDVPIHIGDANESAPIPHRMTRSRMLVLVCIFALGVVTLSKLVLSVLGSTLGVGLNYIQGAEQAISSCLMGLLCIWLAWRPTKWISWRKMGVGGLLILTFLLPWAIEIFSILYSHSVIEYGFIFVGLAIWFSVLSLHITGLDFAGRFCRLQLVSAAEYAEARRLTIRSYFLLTLFLSIPLTIEFWLRRAQLSSSSSTFVDTSSIHYWFGGLVCEILFYIFVAMMFAVPRSKRVPMFMGLLVVLLLKGALSWSLQKSYFTDADLSDPTYLNSYRELLTISVITFVGESVLVPFGFWLIQSAGYDFRIVNSIDESRQEQLDGPHPLE